MKKIISLLLMVAAVFTLAACQPSVEEGAKHVSIEIVYADEELNETVEVNTDAEFLYDVLMENQEELQVETAGEDSEWGAYLTGLKGYNFETLGLSYYWSIFVNGDYGMLGITTQPVADGDTFRFEAAAFEVEPSTCITLETVYAGEDGELIVDESLEVCTNAEFLYDVLIENQEAMQVETAGEDGEFGAYLEGLYGYNFTALELSYYWSIYVNGEYGTLGITTQPVADGDTFKFEATGY